MGLFSNMPVYELGEQKYYRYLQAAHKHSYTTAMHTSCFPKLGASVDCMYGLSPLLHIALILSYEIPF